MKIEYFIVLISKNGFSREESICFSDNIPPEKYYVRKNYDLPMTLTEEAISPEQYKARFKDLEFRRGEIFYALGKNIVLYKEI